jgi:hypothetical protein
LLTGVRDGTSWVLGYRQEDEGCRSLAD